MCVRRVSLCKVCCEGNMLINRLSALFARDTSTLGALAHWFCFATASRSGPDQGPCIVIAGCYDVDATTSSLTLHSCFPPLLPFSRTMRHAAGCWSARSHCWFCWFLVDSFQSTFCWLPSREYAAKKCLDGPLTACHWKLLGMHARDWYQHAAQACPCPNYV